MCKLHKSIYGLKQASRKWNIESTQVVVDSGFVQSKADYSLFTKGHGASFVAILVYVDDIIVAGLNPCIVFAVKDFLHTKFKLKDLGHLKFFLGLEITRSVASIVVCQRNYTLHLLEEFGFLASKPHSTPMNLRVAFQKDGGELLVDPTPYHRLVGRLLNLAITRLNITFTVNTLSQFISTPHSSHMQVATHLLHYLKSEPGLGLSFFCLFDFTIACFFGC